MVTLIQAVEPTLFAESNTNFSLSAPLNPGMESGPDRDRLVLTIRPRLRRETLIRGPVASHRNSLASNNCFNFTVKRFLFVAATRLRGDPDDGSWFIDVL